MACFISKTKILFKWVNFPYNKIMTNFEAPNEPANSSSLDEMLAVVQPLVLWMSRTGIGYTEFATALKPLFWKMAMMELERLERKTSDSAVSLLSGLHRKEVRTYREELNMDALQLQQQREHWGKPSAASQVVTRWLSLGLEDTIAYSGAEPSFEQLAQSVSKDFHPRSVLMEMCRLGVAKDLGPQVRLLKESFSPDAQNKEASQMLAVSVADHLSAGIHNLLNPERSKFLEQSVSADGLSAESIERLNAMARELWAQALKQIVQAATQMVKDDEGCDAPYRFRLGLFTFAADPDGQAALLSPGMDAKS